MSSNEETTTLSYNKDAQLTLNWNYFGRVYLHSGVIENILLLILTKLSVVKNHRKHRVTLITYLKNSVVVDVIRPNE